MFFRCFCRPEHMRACDVPDRLQLGTRCSDAFGPETIVRLQRELIRKRWATFLAMESMSQPKERDAGVDTFAGLDADLSKIQSESAPLRGLAGWQAERASL